MRRWLAAFTAALLMTGAAHAADPAPQPYGWQSIPFGGGGFVDGFLYHPRQKGLLYARTDIGGMYRYDYDAKAWIPLLDGLGHDDGQLMGVLSMAVDPNDANKLYAATGEYLNQWSRAAAVLRSDDQGKTWRKTELSIKLGGNADGRGTGDRLQVDPHDGQVLLLASSQDGLWKSSDGGVTFARIASPGDHLSLVLFDPAHAGTIYIGSADGKGGLFASHDGGGSFTQVDGTPDQTPQHAVFDSDGSLYVTFAGGDGKSIVNPSNATTGGVWKMASDGKWANISPPSPNPGASFGYSGLDVDAEHAGTVVASTLDRWNPGDDIFRSTDGGQHWQALGAQSRHDGTGYPWLVNYARGEDRMGHWIADVRINPFNSDEAIYGTGYGLWMSENLSQASSGTPVRWDFNLRNFEETATLKMTSPTGGAVVMAALGDVGGAAWDDITVSPANGLFTPTNETDFSVDYAGLNPSFVARTVANSPNNGFYSEDGGASWTSFGSTTYKRQDAQGNWHSAGTIAVSAKGTSLLWAPEREDAVFSTDKGKTWTKSQGWPTGRDMTLTPLADKAIDGVYYVFDRYAMAILISVDNGATFKPIVQGIPKIEGWQNEHLAVVPGRVRDLWLAAPYGLLHSEDENHQMKAVPGVDEAWQVGFGKTKVDGGYPAVYVYGKVHGQEGVFRSDDDGQIWTRINDDAHRFGNIDAISGDMLEYGTVYIAPAGRGIMVGKPLG